MKPHLSKLSFLAIGLSLAASVSYLNAWSGPQTGVTPPEGNVSAPVNLSSLAQVKLGGLGVASLLSTGDVAANRYCDLNGNCSSSVGGGSSVPAGTVAAFNLTTCPAGWIPADGNGGTKDLRGSFIRGYGTSTAGTAASGAFGLFQDDAFKSHVHTGSAASNGAHTHTFYQEDYGWKKGGKTGSEDPGGAVISGNHTGTTGSAGAHTHTVTITANTDGGSTETRPDNVALLFCQKDSSVQVSTNTTFAFGGIFSTVSGGCVYSNPYTGNCTCPSGYSESAIYYGTNNGYSNTASYQCYKR